MEMMPFRPGLDGVDCEPPAPGAPPTLRLVDPSTVTTSDWQACLPVLFGTRVTLRELRREDAPSLLALLTTEEVTRFIQPPPSTIEEFERFIDWTHRRRAQGRYVCFGVVPHGADMAVGLFQIHLTDLAAGIAEWGFALGAPYWGTGLYPDGARLVVDFAFAQMGLHRLEARSTIENGRGNGALRKIGAVQEGVLEASFLKDGAFYDQNLWAIPRHHWQARIGWTTCTTSVH